MDLIASNEELVIGCDFVPEMIVRTQKKHGNEKRNFLSLNLAKGELPCFNIILCRDSLTQYDYREVFAAIKNVIKSRSDYLLTTTFPQIKNDTNIISENWKLNNLCKPPFKFPDAIVLINEEHRGNNYRYSCKSLGLWNLNNIFHNSRQKLMARIK